VSADANGHAPAVPRVLSIAGTDPTGGAGIHADLKSIAANGGYGMAVATALVAQNTQGVRAVHTPPPAFLTAQLDAVSDDVTIDAVKIGMLFDARLVRAVSEWLERVRPPLVVLDPVMVAASGDRLLNRDAEASVRELMRQADVVTPNVPELAALAQEDQAHSWEDVIAQAKRLSARYELLVLAKGGHLGGKDSPDALVDARPGTDGGVQVTTFPAARVATRNTHGTGCSLSAAVATRRVITGDWATAIDEAKRWLTQSIAHADALEVGHGHGPVSHFAGLWKRGGTEAPAAPRDLAHQWWDRIGDIRDRIDREPLVIGMSDGDLDAESFRWYLAQDALYLRDYSRVLAHASALAPTAREQGFWATSAHGAIAAELNLHASWLPQGELFAAPPSATTTAYLDHLLAAVGRADYDVIIAALLPCFWIYNDVGQRMLSHAHAGHAYRSWIETYATPEFAAATAQAIAIVSERAAAASPATREAMWQVFRRSAEHELAFFAAPLSRAMDSAIRRTAVARGFR
jgi:hydroxymethylpyrimidine kinase/phosphomethylpyrimidine kinase